MKYLIAAVCVLLVTLQARPAVSQPALIVGEYDTPGSWYNRLKVTTSAAGNDVQNTIVLTNPRCQGSFHMTAYYELPADYIESGSPRIAFVRSDRAGQWVCGALTIPCPALDPGLTAAVFTQPSSQQIRMQNQTNGDRLFTKVNKDNEPSKSAEPCILRRDRLADRLTYDLQVDAIDSLANLDISMCKKIE